MLLPLESIRERFFETGDGLEAVRQRADAVDGMVVRLFEQAFPNGNASGIALAAVGGYGRRQLFPSSDIDLLFVVEKQAAANAAHDSIAVFLRELWDLGLRASQSVHTIGEATTLSSDNIELHISLLDARHLAGDGALLTQLMDRLPPFYVREKETLTHGLARLTRGRHAKYGDTIFHLEPNVKEAPGGIRDFQVACWLAQLAHTARGPLPAPEQYLAEDSRAELLEAKRFFFALRCYLHYFNGRDNNILTFEHQERAAAAASANDPAAWMRDYFRNARAIHRLAVRTIDEFATPDHSLFTLFRDRKSRLSNADFAVTRGLLYLRHPEALEREPGLMLRLFEFVARHGVAVAPETERRIRRAVSAFRVHLDQARRIELSLWPSIASILKLPHAYQALVGMRETSVLAALFPEYERIDCLVIRDFYHRYTVDEHSLRTIKVLHELRESEDSLTRQFAELLQETEHPEILMFALLFHDMGKGAGDSDHISAGLDLAEHAMDRIQMDEQDRETVRFLIRWHLEMSATMTRRDLAEPATARAFAARVATIERLRKLTLMTYADIAAVNPEALTPWRQDLLWQLYVATNNQLTREMEAERIGAADASLAAAFPFLEGIPTRYLRIHTPEQIAEHARLE